MSSTPSSTDQSPPNAAVAAKPSMSSKAHAAAAKAAAYAKIVFGSANENPLKIALYVGAVVVVACTIWYFVSEVSKKKNEIESTHLVVDHKIQALDNGNNVGVANASVDVMTMPLRNFYIKTALNCCCLGEWKNNYVDMAPLISAIKQGYRCLDFEIYSEGNVPVVAASTKNDYYNKEVYNSLPLSGVISTIISNAFPSYK